MTDATFDGVIQQFNARRDGDAIRVW